MAERNLSRAVFLVTILLIATHPMSHAGAADNGSGFQQPSPTSGSQPSQQPVQQDPNQQAPGGQPGGQQGQPPQQPYPAQPWGQQGQPSPQQPIPDQSMPGGQPMVQPGQMMMGQSPCTVKISSDRTVISLMEAGSSQARDHVSINPDRVQKVLMSPDGNWSLVMFKVRGENSFGAIPVDLAKCEAQESVDIPAVTDNAQFEGDAVTLAYPDGTQKKFPLRSK